MKDSLGRTIDYMRISITDRCDLRCKYCMPEGIKLLSMDDLLTYEEIETICKIAAGLGISKIKITGGEPLVRRGVEHLVQTLKSIPGIEKVTMTSNGVTLADHMEALKKSGLDAINISLDTLDPTEFAEITGRDRLANVLAGVEAAVKSGIRVKINTVLRAQITEEMIVRLANYARELGIDLRFIEVMPIGFGKEQDGIYHEDVDRILVKHFGEGVDDPSVHGNGPAVYKIYDEGRLSVGFISAMHGKFCSSCNRIRMSAIGGLKSCLCYKGQIDIREPLRAGDLEEVKKRLIETILDKPKEHCFETIDEITEENQMSSIGG
ncbi:MAG: GTP 3',8-cyclase MoaA [Lachnospiraceae bacterium]|nr:GTP 3',8-cyclase MoaA [Lachnospiraceae bacterium]